MTEDESQGLRAESKRAMLDGIVRLGEGAWQAALDQFDRAVALRGSLPWREDPESAWMLAAAWINRSDALRRLDAVDFPEVIRSLDSCLAAMKFVPLADHPAFAERSILAWINRGTAHGEMGQPTAALADFSEAEGLLEQSGDETRGERRVLNTMLNVNRARVLLETGRIERAWQDAKAGAAALAPLEPGDGWIAEAGVRARSVKCQILAALLERPDGAAQAGDWIAEATDAAEEALAIVKRTGLAEPWVADLVRYGAKIYRVCQPQFLNEFITEWTGTNGPFASNEPLLEEMRNVRLLARAEAEARLLLAPHDDDVAQREMRIIRSLTD